MQEEQKTGAAHDLPARLEKAAGNLKALAGELRKALKGKWSDAVQQRLIASGDAVFAEVRDMEPELKKMAAGRDEQSRRLWLELESRTKELGEKNGWHVAGSWPAFMVADGIQVNFDEKTRSATVGPARVSVQDLSDLESALHAQVKELLPKDFSPQAFLDLMFLAYQDARRNSAQVPVFELYQALVIRGQRPGFWRNAAQDRFSGLTVEQFRARLTRSLTSGVFKTRSGNEIRLFPPLDPKDGLFFFNPLDRRLQFLGRIEFTSPTAAGAMHG